MAAEFVATLPSAKDVARLALGDVGPDFLLQDETYAAVLLVDPEAETPVALPTTPAYVRLARSLASVCANKAVAVQQGTTKRQWIDRAAHYRDLAATWASDGVPEDLAFSTAGALGQVGRLDGPDVEYLGLVNGLYPPCGAILPQTLRLP